MCMGLGCNAAGVTGCRIIDSPRERLISILTNAFVPCNGRFPFLITIASIFFAGSMGGFSSIGATFISVCVPEVSPSLMQLHLLCLFWTKKNKWEMDYSLNQIVLKVMQKNPFSLLILNPRDIKFSAMILLNIKKVSRIIRYTFSSLFIFNINTIFVCVPTLGVLPFFCWQGTHKHHKGVHVLCHVQTRRLYLPNRQGNHGRG